MPDEPVSIASCPESVVIALAPLRAKICADSQSMRNQVSEVRVIQPQHYYIADALRGPLTNPVRSQSPDEPKEFAYLIKGAATYCTLSGLPRKWAVLVTAKDNRPYHYGKSMRQGLDVKGRFGLENVICISFCC